MSSSLEEALQRTSLSSSNQMEMLTFRLTDEQLYGINVFKIIEIIECSHRVDRIPHSHPAVKGVLDFRGTAITAIDLSEAIGLPTKNFVDELAYVIICEYNQRLTAFIVHYPETLLTRNWSDIHRPDGVNSAALVAIAYADNNESILLLDIESVLATVVGIDHHVDHGLASEAILSGESRHILLVDDSRAAQVMMQDILNRLGYTTTTMHSAPQALDYLEREHAKIDLVISDIEMPGMDGFTFTRTLRGNPQLKHLKVLLHSSMSNPSNRVKAEEAGSNGFVAKFDPDVLVKHVVELIADNTATALT